MLCAWTLIHREFVRFFRQRNRVIGALAQPLIFWALFGAGLRASFTPAGMPEGMSYAEYFFPGILAMILLFTAIFATISIIEDRKEGFMQSVLVAPVSRASLVFGKIMGGALLATVQAALVLLFAPWMNIPLSIVGVLATLGSMLLIAVALTGLGFAIAWRSESTQGYHAIMSVFLFPMWLLSGAFFPAEGAPGWLYWTIKLNPLTYGVELLRHTLYMGRDVSIAAAESVPAWPLALGISAGFAVVTFALSYKSAARRIAGDLQ